MSTSTPKTHAAKKPQDRKKSAAELHEERLAREELLAGMPELKPAHKLRIRDRNKVAAIIFNTSLFDRAEELEGVDESELSKDDIADMLEVAAQIDEFAESIAVDREAYIEWAAGKDYDVFFAILDLYGSAVGESKRSAS